jgi:hypothetical protein
MQVKSNYEGFQDDEELKEKQKSSENCYILNPGSFSKNYTFYILYPLTEKIESS